MSISALDRLKKLKSVLETQKQEKAKIEGQLEAAMGQLHVLGYKSVKEAEKALTKMEGELQDLDAEIEATVQKLETQYADLL